MSLLLWSGGLDSTLILHDIAKEARDGTKHHPHGIRVLSVIHEQVGCHQKAAAKSRESIKIWLRRQGMSPTFINLEWKQEWRSWRAEQGIGSANNPQAFLWFTIAMNYLEPDEDLYAGYIRGDDFWHHIGAVRHSFGALKALAGHGGTMIFPLEWERKSDVIRRTKELGLYDLCWWCEENSPPKVNRKLVACGKCQSCLTNEAGLWELERAKKLEVQQ